MTEIGGTLTITDLGDQDPRSAPVVIGMGGRMPPTRVITVTTTIRATIQLPDGLDFYGRSKHARPGQ